MLSSGESSRSRPYFTEGYTHIFRWISYFHQIELVRPFRGSRVLEIGIGDKTPSNYLKRHGVDVTTCDIDADLEPDVLGDVRQLPFADRSFDCESAFEILEHIPWGDVDSALSELSRVSRSDVHVSVPCFGPALHLAVKLPRFRRLVNLLVRLPIPFLRIDLPAGGSHHWEIGRKHYPLKKIRAALKERFHIDGESSPPLVPSHYFFTLRKRV